MRFITLILLLNIFTIVNSGVLPILNTTEHNVYKINDDKDKDVLFVISHNKSPNIVVYRANFISHDLLNTKDPFDVFWLMKSKGNTVEDITYIEKKTAFGFKVEKIEDNKRYRIRLKALAEKYIDIIKNKSGKFESFITINDTRIRLENIFVEFEYTLYGPNVKYLDFKRRNPVNGEKIVRRYYNK